MKRLVALQGHTIRRTTVNGKTEKLTIPQVSSSSMPRCGPMQHFSSRVIIALAFCMAVFPLRSDSPSCLMPEMMMMINAGAFIVLLPRQGFCWLEGDRPELRSGSGSSSATQEPVGPMFCFDDADAPFGSPNCGGVRRDPFCSHLSFVIIIIIIIIIIITVIICNPFVLVITTARLLLQYMSSRLVSENIFVQAMPMTMMPMLFFSIRCLWR